MQFEVRGSEFYKDGERVKIISGAVHYFRNMPATWEDIFLKLKAMGCNCVETYCAWNMHEKEKGKFDFSGILDITAFLQKAQEHGLMVIVRPGPYICAEWDFGGLPWWLQVEADMEIRCLNATYMEYFTRYLFEIFNRIKPFLATNGGNVIMMQVENEYGYYGDDKAYLRKLVEIYRENGIDVPLFTADGSQESVLLDGAAEGCLPLLNFGSRVQENFVAQEKLFPNSPKMCMEMWNGWFDAWGEEKHHTRDPEEYAKTIDDMLAVGSVNMYMFIGGTNFGFTAGANHGATYTPDVTSYDYDALLSECGDITPKYLAVRKVIEKYTDTPLPPIPANRAKKGYGKASADGYAPLFDNLSVLSKPTFSKVPKCMEAYGTGYGYILYESTLNRDYDEAVVTLDSIGDRAQVYINEDYVGTIFVNDEILEVPFTAKKGDVLRILCENMGRTNFGFKMMYKKGLSGRCLINGKVHFDWRVYPLPMEGLEKLPFAGQGALTGGSFYRFHLQVEGTPCDSFLRTDNFKKGFAVVNGFNLGRYWEIGPQMALYVPASVLKEGDNEIILFESDGVKGEPVVEFVDTPDIG